MRNRATQERYPPGSTFKLVTAAAALSNGYSPDSLVKGGAVLDLPQTDDDLHNENGCSCGGNEITLTQRARGLVQRRVRRPRPQARARTPCGSRPRSSASTRTSSTSCPPAPTASSPRTSTSRRLAFSAIGQFDVAATPLQMAMVAAGIANGGDVMKPYVVQAGPLARRRDPRRGRPRGAAPGDLRWRRRRPDPDDGRASSRTAPAATCRSPASTWPARPAPPTPTPDRSPYAWMVTFAPADDAEVAVAVFIESTDGRARRRQRQRPRRADRQSDHGSGDRPMTGQPAVATSHSDDEREG